MVDDPYLLKMDCEGCEAQVILGPERERLRGLRAHNIWDAPSHYWRQQRQASHLT